MDGARFLPQAELSLIISPNNKGTCRIAASRSKNKSSAGWGAARGGRIPRANSKSSVKSIGSISGFRERLSPSFLFYVAGPIVPIEG